MGYTAVILAAGQGTRMRSRLPKVLHSLAGKPLLQHVCELTQAIGCQRNVVIYGYGGAQVREAFAESEVIWVEQSQQLGTGHAVLQTVPHLIDADRVAVFYGDVPGLRIETAQALLRAGETADVTLLTAVLDNPTGYGRIVRDGRGAIQRIVEELDATDEERNITEINTGILTVRANLLQHWLPKLSNDNAKGEYYLTDIIALAVTEGCIVKSVCAPHAEEALGVNTRAQLAVLERKLQLRYAEELMAVGVSFADPQRFDLRGQVVTCGQDVTIDINVVLEGRIAIGERVRIGAGAVLRNVEIDDDVEILPYTIIEDAHIGTGSRIGPFARIRPDTILGEHVHIGNFVEIKKSSVASGSKINHLSYVGDCLIGHNVNIGAGTITCNYDGAYKHRTVIEDGVFVGSDTQFIAPVHVGKNATIGAGSTIVKDVPAEQLTLSRSPQISVPGWQRPRKR